MGNRVLALCELALAEGINRGHNLSSTMLNLSLLANNTL